MLSVCTGTPGNGKTAHALDLCFFDKSSMWYSLDKYVDGVAELKLEHFEFPDIKELKRKDFVPRSQVDSEEYAVWLPENPLYPSHVEALATAKTAWDLWYLWATPNSLLLIDEAQRYMRPRPAGSPVPLAIQMIEYHRHFGIHLFFITQKERLLHSNVRMLAGQHIHLTDGWRGRHRFEWPECKDSDSKSEKAVSAHTDYKLPKHVFPFYKSTVQHLTTSHAVPMYRKIMYLAMLVFPVLGYFIYQSFANPVKPKALASQKSGEIIGVVSSASGVSASGVLPVVLVGHSADFVPVVAGRPETAPAFDELRRVVVMPVISACLQNAARCFCYTQQGTRILDMLEASCRQYLEKGQPFNPYVQPVQVASNTSASGFGGVGDSKAGSIVLRSAPEPVSASDVGRMVAER